MDLTLISEKIQAGRAKEVKALVQQALDEGVEPNRILNEGLMAGMAVVGGSRTARRLFRKCLWRPAR